MTLFLRLGRYLLPQWRTVLFGLLCMVLFAALSGVSIGLVLPVMDQVFLRAKVESTAEPLPLGEGLDRVWDTTREAFDGPGSLSERTTAAREAGRAALGEVLHRSPPRDILLALCVVTVLAILFKNLFDYGQHVAFLRVEHRTGEGLRRDVFRHTLALPLAEHRRQASGQLLSRLVTDIELVKQFTVHTAVTLVKNSLQVLVFVGVCVWASPRLSVVSFLVVPPIVLVTGRLASRLRRYSGRAQARIADLTSAVSESLANIRVVKGFGMEGKELRRFQTHNHDYANAMIRLFSLDKLAAPLSELWGVIIGVSVLFYGGQLVLDPGSPMTPGRFFVFFLALISILHPLKMVANTFTAFQRGAAAGDRVWEVLDTPAETDAPDAVPFPGLHREVRFSGVGFAYAAGRPVLEDVELTVPAGTTMALVGPSGGGKSTLMDMLPRFHDPDIGRIEVDGVDLRGIRLEDLRRHIGIVTQETILFDDTVHANIAYGVEDADRERVEAAARLANAHEFIVAMEDGYDTVIGERGARLSGGQRQRLAIARALLRDPAILVLDEATSSLDTESEAAVQEALDRLVARRTTFVIAHRLSTVMNADRICVLDKGRVVEEGTHRELLARGALYRRLHDLQFRDQEAV